MMISVGYIAKRVAVRPDWIKSNLVKEIYSVSDCISKDFADYINYWKHNGYWFFDSPEIIQQLAKQNAIDLTGTKLFYYEVFPQEFDGHQWKAFEPESSFTINIESPRQKILEGYDVVTFSCRTSPECSPLSCNSLAEKIETNQHCLLSSLERAKQLLENGDFNNSEPGPFRIFAVYSVEWT